MRRSGDIWFRLGTDRTARWGGGGKADAADLNSAGRQGRVGSTPIRPTWVPRLLVPTPADCSR